MNTVLTIATAVTALAMAAAEAAEPPAVVGWRNDGSGQFPIATPPLKWSRSADGKTENVIWQSRMPADSPSSPIVAGKFVFTTANNYSLVCADKATGRIVWVKQVSPYDAATKEEREANKDAFAAMDKLAATRDDLCAKMPAASEDDVGKLGAELAKVEREIEKLIGPTDKEKFKPTGMTYSDGGCMSTTPVSDGEHVWAWNGWGVTACFDMAGNRKWLRFDKLLPQEHGHHSSPLLVGGKLVVCLGKHYLALDGKTGREVWRSEPHTKDWSGYWYASHVAAKVGGEDVVVAGDGSLLRASDGVRFAKGGGHQAAPSPIVAGEFVVWMLGPSRTPLNYYPMPANAGAPFSPAVRGRKFDMSEPPLTPKGGLNYYMQASPLHHEGLLYFVSSGGLLVVYDMKAEQEVYRRNLDFGEDPKRQDRPYGCGLVASPAMAGGKIFITGNFGTTIVLAPGREYKEIARNTMDRRIEHNYRKDMLEGHVASPFFDGGRIFIRAQRYLYCVGEASR